MNADHRALQEMLGAYVLGQLDPDERAAVDIHLTGCGDCRAELTGLQPMAAALRGLDPDLADDRSSPPPDALREQVLHLVHGRRLAAIRMTRVRRAAAGLLVAASVLTAFGVGRWSNASDPEPPVVAVAVHLDQPGIEAEAGLVEHTWGTELQLQATGLTAGARYAVTFVGSDGAQVSAGSFLGTGDRPVRCSVNAGLPIRTATAFVVTDSTGAMVLDADL